MQTALFKFMCPICREFTLETDDVHEATWVALGEAVCSRECHENAYDLFRTARKAQPCLEVSASPSPPSSA